MALQAYLYGGILNMNWQDPTLTAWNTDTEIAVTNSTDPAEIVRTARPCLSDRDIAAVVDGYRAGHFEMVATFVWKKASINLKKQISALGMDFVGQMLGRPDLDDTSDPATSIGDHEAISLAEDLAMISATQSMRLKHGLLLVNHFANLDVSGPASEGMDSAEVLMLLKTCTSAILAKPHSSAAASFAIFRKALSERTLHKTGTEIETIKASPYFFVRTTVYVLLSLMKGAKGAALEHAIGNAQVIFAELWDQLREQERWQVGQAYAEANNNGSKSILLALRKALLSVHGFDYVPESLRSSSFIHVANRVLNAHYEQNNFYLEPAPIRILADLGTAIPKPAFAKCMEATLAVRLGNQWGHSFAAQDSVIKILESLRQEQWEYYFDYCLVRDRTVLDKIADDGKPLSRWRELVSTFQLHNMDLKDLRIRDLLTACSNLRVPNSNVAQRVAEIRSLYKQGTVSPN